MKENAGWHASPGAQDMKKLSLALFSLVLLFEDDLCRSPSGSEPGERNPEVRLLGLSIRQPFF